MAVTVASGGNRCFSPFVIRSFRPKYHVSLRM